MDRFVGSRPSVSSGEENDTADGELVEKVLQLMYANQALVAQVLYILLMLSGEKTMPMRDSIRPLCTFSSSFARATSVMSVSAAVKSTTSWRSPFN